MREECASTTGSGKRESATPNVEQGIAEEKKVSHQCNGCAQTLEQKQTFRRCKCCNLVNYCSRKCQRIHWPQHKTLCNAIKHQIRSRTRQDSSSGIFISHLTPKQHHKVVDLVGRRCSIKGKLNGRDSVGHRSPSFYRFSKLHEGELLKRVSERYERTTGW